LLTGGGGANWESKEEADPKGKEDTALNADGVDDVGTVDDIVKDAAEDPQFCFAARICSSRCLFGSARLNCAAVGLIAVIEVVAVDAVNAFGEVEEVFDFEEKGGDCRTETDV
jgi:hypothetical protein